MKRLLFLTAVALLAGTLCACVPTLRVADGNFQKARHLRLAGLDEEAAPKYAEAASAYSNEFTRRSEDGRAPFLSSRLKAGMSMYWSGRHKDAFELFNGLFDAGGRSLETIVYGGLSAAALDRREDAVKMWSAMDATYGMYILQQGIEDALEKLEGGSITLPRAAEQVRDALWRQDRKNVRTNLKPQTQLDPPEHCAGRFWWRYSASPCSTPPRFLDD